MTRHNRFRPGWWINYVLIASLVVIAATFWWLS